MDVWFDDAASDDQLGRSQQKYRQNFGTLLVLGGRKKALHLTCSHRSTKGRDP
jgi:hypothetical protein